MYLHTFSLESFRFFPHPFPSHCFPGTFAPFLQKQSSRNLCYEYSYPIPDLHSTHKYVHCSSNKTFILHLTILILSYDFCSPNPTIPTVSLSFSSGSFPFPQSKCLIGLDVAVLPELPIQTTQPHAAWSPLAIVPVGACIPRLLFTPSHTFLTANISSPKVGRPNGSETNLSGGREAHILHCKHSLSLPLFAYYQRPCFCYGGVHQLQPLVSNSDHRKNSNRFF